MAQLHHRIISLYTVLSVGFALFNVLQLPNNRSLKHHHGLRDCAIIDQIWKHFWTHIEASMHNEYVWRSIRKNIWMWLLYLISKKYEVQKHICRSHYVLEYFVPSILETYVLWNRLLLLFAQAIILEEKIPQGLVDYNRTNLN